MFVLNLVTPLKKVLTEAEVEEILVPAYKGQLNILPGHAPLMSTLTVGLLKYRLKGSTSFETVAVSWGYVQVDPHGVTVLAETDESTQEIDRARAEAALKKAEAMLMEPILEPNQIHELQHRVALSTARIHAHDGSSSTTH